jgi:hypothetical protein
MEKSTSLFQKIRENEVFFQILLWIKLAMVAIGFCLTVYAQYKDITYDQEYKKLSEIQDQKEREKAIAELDDGHQSAITFTLIALTLLFMETLTTSSVQLFLYYRDRKNHAHFMKEIDTIKKNGFYKKKKKY